MGAMASQITEVSIVYAIFNSALSSLKEVVLIIKYVFTTN